MKKLKYISAPCGAGKTTAICGKINKSEKFFIVVQSTIALINQTKNEIRNSKAITSESTTNVTDEVKSVLESKSHKVLLITDKVFFNLPLYLLKGWKIYLDDVVNFHTYKSVVEEDENLIAYIKSKLDSNCSYIGEDKKIVKANCNSKYTGQLGNSVEKEMSVFVGNDYIVYNRDFVDKDHLQVYVAGFKSLEKYLDLDLDLTFISANFEQSLMYKCHKNIFKKARLNELKNRAKGFELANRIKVYYFSDRRLSTCWKDDNPDKMQKIYNYLRQILKYKEYYWTQNNNDKWSLDGTKIKPDSRGLNNYQECSICVFLASMKPSKQETSFLLNLFDISYNDMVIAREYETLHQFVLRGVSRDFDSSEEQIVYVFDKEQAQYLSDNIEKIDGVIDESTTKPQGRPKGSRNKEQSHTLSDAITKRFNRWFAEGNTSLGDYNDFLNRAVNNDLSSQDKEALYKKYTKRISKKHN